MCRLVGRSVSSVWSMAPWPSCRRSLPKSVILFRSWIRSLLLIAFLYATLVIRLGKVFETLLLAWEHSCCILLLSMVRMWTLLYPYLVIRTVGLSVCSLLRLTGADSTIGWKGVSVVWLGCGLFLI